MNWQRISKDHSAVEAALLTQRHQSHSIINNFLMILLKN